MLCATPKCRRKAAHVVRVPSPGATAFLVVCSKCLLAMSSRLTETETVKDLP